MARKRKDSLNPEENANPLMSEPVVEDPDEVPEPSDEALDETQAPQAEELQAALAELDELQDRHLRLAAEFENFRKRTRKEQASMTATAQADLARRLLPTLDDLARVAATPSDSTSVEALEKGMELILRNLTKELEDAGLTRVEAQDARFDPEVHQALLITEASDPEMDETVSRVFVDGYLFRDRLVRPAQVEVRRYEPPTPDAEDTEAAELDAAEDVSRSGDD